MFIHLSQTFVVSLRKIGFPIELREFIVNTASKLNVNVETISAFPKEEMNWVFLVTYVV